VTSVIRLSPVGVSCEGCAVKVGEVGRGLEGAVVGVCSLLCQVQ
jgi:hypothetical protein